MNTKGVQTLEERVAFLEGQMSQLTKLVLPERRMGPRPESPEEQRAKMDRLIKALSEQDIYLPRRSGFGKAKRADPAECAKSDSMLCDHANEVPNTCPCEGPCYCKRPGGPCDTSW